MKKLIASAVLSVLSLSLPSQASLIGDFEGTYDGWATSNTTLAYSDFGVTSGISSLEMSVPGGWNIVLEKSLVPVIGELSQATAITMDVTVRNDNNQIPSWWLGVDFVINSDETGWTGLTGTGFSGAQWSPTTSTVSYEITPAIRAAFANGSSSANLLLITNTGEPAKLWVDNIQIVPEPATISVLGLGLTSLLKRRRF